MDFTPVLTAIRIIITATFIYFIIPYIKSRTTIDEQKEINKWVSIAVAAAEQIFIGAGRGQEKKEYVLKFLAEHNIILDEDAIDALIEAAVYELKHGIIPVGDDNA